MRVAIIRKRYTAFGGAERFIDRLSDQLSSTGIRITVLAESWKNDQPENINWIPVKSKGLFRASQDWSFRKSVAELLERTEFDIVQTHERLLGADIFRVGDGLHIAWLDRYKRTMNLLKRLSVNCDPFHHGLLDIERKIALESQTIFVANSALIASELSDFYGLNNDRVVVIPNGIDTSFFTVPSFEFKLESKRQFGFSDTDRVISFVGSGFFRKGLEELLYALKRLPPNVKLIIAGSDKRRTRYQRLTYELHLADRVNFLGSLNDVRQVYSASDLFVLPTLYDPGSNAALEAMSCGLPIISTEDMGTMQEIALADAGRISKRNAESLCEIIGDTLLSSVLSKLGRNARRLAETMDQSLIVLRWLELYRKICER